MQEWWWRTASRLDGHPYSAGGGDTTLLLDGPTAMGGAGTLIGSPVVGDNAGAAVGMGAGGAEVLIGTVSFWPILRKSEVNPLTDLRFATLVRYLSAMWPSVSPLFTVYTLAASGVGSATTGADVADVAGRAEAFQCGVPADNAATRGDGTA